MYKISFKIHWRCAIYSEAPYGTGNTVPNMWIWGFGSCILFWYCEYFGVFFFLYAAKLRAAKLLFIVSATIGGASLNATLCQDPLLNLIVLFNTIHWSGPFCPSGAASIGKGIGGILFSRFSRSSGQVGAAEEEPSDFEGRTTELDNAAGEKAMLPESDKKEKQVEDERREIEQAMSQSASVVLDHTTCKCKSSLDSIVELSAK